jgi:hypothetical protein
VIFQRKKPSEPYWNGRQMFEKQKKNTTGDFFLSTGKLRRPFRAQYVVAVAILKRRGYVE